MRVIRNRLLPLGSYRAINLFGFVFAKAECDDVTLRHESIHTAQGQELAWIGFYILYVGEWLWRLIETGGNGEEAYRRISFEREAYAHQKEAGYLEKRRKWNWMTYLRREQR